MIFEPREIIVKVTQRHITQGEPCNDAKCPIALAILDSTEAESVSVDTLGVKIDHILYSLTDEVEDFIVRVDDDQEVFPFTCKLTPIA